MKNITVFLSSLLVILGVSCSRPDYYGDVIAQQLLDHYSEGGGFVSRSEWADYEMKEGYHIYLSLSGGAHSDDYNFNLISEPEIRSSVKIKRLEIVHDQGVEVVFVGASRIEGSVFLGTRKGADLRKLCDGANVLNVRLVTSEKNVLFRLKRSKSSLLDVT